LKRLFFEFTCQYGMAPGRPLQILVFGIPLFAIWYAIAWKNTMTLDLASWLRVLRLSLHFSLSSTLGLAWRAGHMRNWLTRRQTPQYSLSATGWVRIVAMLQALLGFYLLVLWGLTYFSRPFE
jgi:hypothetical protein